MRPIITFLIFLFLCSSIINSQNFWQEIEIPDSITNTNVVFVDSLNNIYLGAYDMGAYTLFIGTDTWVAWDFNGAWPPHVNDFILKNNYFTIVNGNGVFRKHVSESDWVEIGDRGATKVFITSTGTILTSSGGIHRSSDNGESWEFTELFDEMCYVRVSTFLELDNIIYATISIDGYCPEQPGFYRSFDDGLTWEAPCDDFLGQWCSDLAIDSLNRLYMATWTSGGIMRSEDQGETWVSLSDPTTFNCIAINKYNHIFVGSGNESPGYTWRSDNYGETWELIHDGYGGGMVGSMFIGPDGYIYSTSFFGHLNKSILPTATYPPLLFTPLNNDTLINYEAVDFYWSDIAYNSGYIFQLDTIDSFDSPYLFQSDVDIDSTHLFYPRIDFDINYYWRIATKTEADTSVWSDMSTFYSRKIDDINENLGKNVMIFPNPAKDFIYISSNNNILFFELFDINGKLLLQKTINPNEKIKTIAPPSGIYFYTLKDFNDILISSGKLLTY